MNLHDQMKANSLFENENMLDTFIQTRNSKHEELEEMIENRCGDGEQILQEAITRITN